MSLESRLSALIAAIGADIKALQSAGGGGGGGSVYRVPSNIVYSGTATTAANIMVNQNSTEIWSISVPAGQRLRVDGLIMFVTAAATTGIAMGVNITTGATGTIDATLDADLGIAVTHLQGTSLVHQIGRYTSVSQNQTSGIAMLNTGSTTSVNGGRVQASLVNRGTSAVTFRLRFGSEILNSAVTVQANSCIDYQLHTL